MNQRREELKATTLTWGILPGCEWQWQTRQNAKLQPRTIQLRNLSLSIDPLVNLSTLIEREMSGSGD